MSGSRAYNIGMDTFTLYFGLNHRKFEYSFDDKLGHTSTLHFELNHKKFEFNYSYLSFIDEEQGKMTIRQNSS